MSGVTVSLWCNHLILFEACAAPHLGQCRTRLRNECPTPPCRCSCRSPCRNPCHCLRSRPTCPPAQHRLHSKAYPAVHWDLPATRCGRPQVV
uniref:Secreted protein n=1 Tax=Ixodes ricinus TaxID=34613 RepID=A0A6B0U453_IXORI